MKRITTYFCFLLFFLISCTYQQRIRILPEIHCKHFIYGYPAGTPETNDMIIRDIYALSSNDGTKLADWVAYRLDPATIMGDVSTSRIWKPDPWLEEGETLEPEDYKDAYEVLETDRGHQAPLASFKGTNTWEKTNYLSNITPQKSELNRGPWSILEQKVRNFVQAGNTLYVMTGPCYDKTMPSLPKADEPHTIPSGYWKIIVFPGGNNITCASFLFDQETTRNSEITDHLCTINDIELKTGLDFLRELPDIREEEIENKLFREWAEINF